MKTHNFKLVGGDTDSIMFCKKDGAPFSKEEQANLLSEINSLLPKEIKFANDGIFSKVIYAKAKNYVMVDEKGKRKVKGSAFKSSTLEPALKELLMEMVDVIIKSENYNQVLIDIYNKHVKKVLTITDIMPYAKKATLSPTTFKSERTNETKIIDAIRGSEFTSGDKVYLYTTNENKLKLVSQYSKDYDLDTYLKKLFNTAQRFKTVMDTKTMFPNYSLKRSKLALEELK